MTAKSWPVVAVLWLATMAGLVGCGGAGSPSANDVTGDSRQDDFLPDDPLRPDAAGDADINFRPSSPTCFETLELPGGAGGTCDTTADCVSGYCMQIVGEAYRTCICPCISQCPVGYECRFIETGAPEEVYGCLRSDCPMTCEGLECGVTCAGELCGTCNGLDDDCDGTVDENSCDDGNPCTEDLCLPESGGCQNLPIPCPPVAACPLGPCEHLEFRPETGDYLIIDPCEVSPDPCLVTLCDPLTRTCVLGENCRTIGCWVGTCKPGTGGCSYSDLPCTVDDECKSGCRVTEPCQRPFCDSDTGICAMGVDPCDDGNPCTQDWCVAGAGCEHKEICQVPCTVDADCKDGSQCPEKKCGNDGFCFEAAVTYPCCNVDADCEFDSPYVIAICYNHLCNPDWEGCGNSYTCDDQNPCTQDICDLSSLTCKHKQIWSCCLNDSDCDELGACIGSHCDLITHHCQYPWICLNDGDPGTVDTCGP